MIDSAARIFISYASADRLAAGRLYDELCREGFNPWIDSRDLLAGSRRSSVIRDVIHKSRYFILLISSESMTKRGIVHREIREAIDALRDLPPSDRFLIPTRLESCEVTHDELRNLQWVDLFPDWDQGLRKLLRSLGQMEDFRSCTHGEHDTYPIALARFQIDDWRCAWSTVPGKINHFYALRPPWGRFYDFFDSIVPFEKLSVAQQEMFRHAHSFIVRSLKEYRQVTEGIEDGIGSISRLNPSEFYSGVLSAARWNAEHGEPSIEKMSDFSLDAIDHHVTWSLVNIAWNAAQHYRHVDRWMDGVMGEFTRTFFRGKDPIFDVILMNDGTNAEVMQMISLEVRGFHEVMKAGPPLASYFLESLADFKLFLSRFDEEGARGARNVLRDPLVIVPGHPARFSVELCNLEEACPGNVAILSIKFDFASKVVSTGELFFDI